MLRQLLVFGALLLTILAGCGAPRSDRPGESSGNVVIRVEGSDTMVNLAQAWAENYHKAHPAVSVQILGGGSGVGIASLIDGNCDLANASREMRDKEIKLCGKKRGIEPRQHLIGHDALAVYVHRSNPLEAISLEELAEIYGEGGKTTTWGQLNVRIPGSASDEIIRVSRQNNSGTYFCFHETVLGPRREFKLGSIDQSGSKDVVALVSRTPCAIGYSGMGYATPEVKMVKVSAKGGAPTAPSSENARSGAYPLTRALYIYTAGEPTGAVKEYLDWILSPDGQKVVTELGYVAAR